MTRFTYDGFGQVLTIKDALNRVVTYDYNGNGDVTKVINEAGINTTASYDILGRTSWVGMTRRS